MIHGLQHKSTLLLFPSFYYLHSVPVAFMLPHLQQTYSLHFLLPVKHPPPWRARVCMEKASLPTAKLLSTLTTGTSGIKWYLQGDAWTLRASESLVIELCSVKF